MPSFVATPRTADDERALAILHRLSARAISASEAVDSLFDLSAESDLDGEIAAQAVHLVAETATSDDLGLVEQLLLGLLRDADDEPISATGATNRPVEMRPVTKRPTTLPPVTSERSETITVAVTVPA